MPKISTNNIRVFNDNINETFQIEVNYNKDNLFYAVVPEQFNEAWDHLSEAEMKEFKTQKLHKSKHSMFSGGQFKRIVSDSHEAECIESMRKLLQKLIKECIVKKDVIIVFYNPKDNCQYGNFEENKQHPQIGMQFSLTYAQETSVGNGKKIYNVFRHYKSGITEERDETSRREVSVWGGNYTIIDDTPENRIFLEDIYFKLNNLKLALTEYTKSPETLVQLIESKQLLLA